MSESIPLPVAPEGSRFARAHRILLIFLGLAVAVWLLSGFYQVKLDEEAIVERLGQYVSTEAGKAIPVEHGLHYHLPWPIDRVHIISVGQQLTLSVKAFNASPSEYDDFKREYLNNPDNPFGANRMAIDAVFDPYLISADKSLLHMEVSVRFRIRDPERWLNSVSHDFQESYDPNAKNDQRNQFFQQIAQRALIAQAARLPFEELFLGGRDFLPVTLQGLVQKGSEMEAGSVADPLRMEMIDLGIQVQSVEVTVVRPPDAVKPALENVFSQRSNRDTAKSKAAGDAQAMLIKATGEKETLLLDAEAYKLRVTKEAEGERDRFRQILEQYQNAPDVTRWNLFVEAATSVTGNAKRIFFAQPGQRTYIELDPAQYDSNQVRPAGN